KGIERRRRSVFWVVEMFTTAGEAFLAVSLSDGNWPVRLPGAGEVSSFRSKGIERRRRSVFWVVEMFTTAGEAFLAVSLSDGNWPVRLAGAGELSSLLGEPNMSSARSGGTPHMSMLTAMASDT